MAKVSELKKRFEKNGWSFTKVMGTGNVIAKKGSRTEKGTSYSDVFKKL